MPSIKEPCFDPNCCYHNAKLDEAVNDFVGQLKEKEKYVQGNQVVGVQESLKFLNAVLNGQEPLEFKYQAAKAILDFQVAILSLNVEFE